MSCRDQPTPFPCVVQYVVQTVSRKINFVLTLSQARRLRASLRSSPSASPSGRGYPSRWVETPRTSVFVPLLPGVARNKTLLDHALGPSPLFHSTFALQPLCLFAVVCRAVSLHRPVRATCCINPTSVTQLAPQPKLLDSHQRNVALCRGPVPTAICWTLRVWCDPGLIHIPTPDPVIHMSLTSPAGGPHPLLLAGLQGNRVRHYGPPNTH